ncbi:PREDICTED: uncharacterized protein LOC108372462 isoform X1 [Rhagoletis zephyria]|uniref:uncharacterized protein LOC108372462 isoform X1 n=1 Tax=Rhagoletis zephyria TaxID=28612 RepID=UPI0008115B16|nr:PREDICTED: uncharacterized protein LOC108372462 isoform X1 [Rhagoletis zephyria]
MAQGKSDPLSLALATLASADISLHNGYNNNNQWQHPPYNPGFQQPLIMHLLQQQMPGSIGNPMQITQPSQQYLPMLQQQRQPLTALQPLYPVPPQKLAPLPMPANFPAPAGFRLPLAPISIAKQQRRSRQRVKVAKKPIVTKSFFIHTAPEDNEDELREELNHLAAQPRKHYNVLFVKTPAQTSKVAAVNLAKALKEEKTVVYVLAKKTSATDLQEAIQEEPQQINKPEVFFIKYRTPEEAANAQRQIQSQYDSLGGTSTITDEGLAPVTSVVGSLDAPEEEEDEEEQQLGQQPLIQQQQDTAAQYEDQPSNAINPAAPQYLPPAKQ